MFIKDCVQTLHKFVNLVNSMKSPIVFYIDMKKLFFIAIHTMSYRVQFLLPNFKYKLLNAQLILKQYFFSIQYWDTFNSYLFISHLL